MTKDLFKISGLTLHSVAMPSSFPILPMASNAFL